MSLKQESCLSRKDLSSSSAVAKCVKIPSISMLGSMEMRFTKLTVWAGVTPIRPMPVSTFTWHFAFFPSFTAALDNASANSYVAVAHDRL